MYIGPSFPEGRERAGQYARARSDRVGDTARLARTANARIYVNFERNGKSAQTEGKEKSTCQIPLTAHAPILSSLGIVVPHPRPLSTSVERGVFASRSRSLRSGERAGGEVNVLTLPSESSGFARHSGHHWSGRSPL